MGETDRDLESGVMLDVRRELHRAFEKHGPRYADLSEGLIVIMEEAGEVAKEILEDGGLVSLYSEAIQVAASAIKLAMQVSEEFVARAKR